jgi:hypothetical protein
VFQKLLEIHEKKSNEVRKVNKELVEQLGKTSYAITGKGLEFNHIEQTMGKRERK